MPWILVAVVVVVVVVMLTITGIRNGVLFVFCS
jgi:hypothetical protein